MMIGHHIKVAIRNIKKQGWYAAMNIAGLSIGVAISVMILLLVKYELSFDSQFSKSDLIYRYTTKGVIGTDVVNGAPTPMPLGDLLRKFEEVQDVVRIYVGSNKLIAYDEKKFGEEKFFFGDSLFFRIFDLPLVAGEFDLTSAGNVVITRSTAKKYFGYADPIGKTITREEYKFRVVGICEDMPDASHFHFDFMASMQSIDDILIQKGDSLLAKNWHEDWLDLKCYTYLKFKPFVSINDFELKVNNEKLGFVESQLRNIMDQDAQRTIVIDFFLQPIQEIHLFSSLDNELENNSNLIYVNLLVFAAVLILLITCVNFINLTTSRANRRFHEVGLRKLLGAVKFQLVIQFLTEAILYSVSAMFLGLVLLELMLPLMNSFFGLNIAFLRVHSLMDLFWILSIVVVVGILIGSYPAFFFSGMRSRQDTLELHKFGKIGFVLRGVLVSCQIAVTVFLLIMAAGMWWQINYMRNADLGYRSENILVIKRARTLGMDVSAFKAEVKNIDGVRNVAGCWNIPGDELAVTPFEVNTNGKHEIVKLSFIITDEDYFETLGLTLKAGRFLGDSKSDTMGVLLNMTAIKEFNIKKPLGERLGFLGVKDWDMTVVGVLRDYYFQSLYHKIQPQAIFLAPEVGSLPYMLVSFTENISESSIDSLGNVWKKYTEGSPFEWERLDDRLSALYDEDVRIAKITSVISFLALFMTVLGIIALSAFVAEFKARPIGIKKILGASRQTIMLNVFSVFGIYSISGVLVAMIPTYLMLNLWGQRFAYFDLINSGYFLMIALFMIGVIFASVFYQIYRVASNRPVNVWQYD